MSGAFSLGQPSVSIGKIDSVPALRESFSPLFMNEMYSDVTLIVDGQRFPAHKFVLAIRSDYFRALLYGGMRESTIPLRGEIELKDTPAASFRCLLQHIYTGQINHEALDNKTLLDVICVADKYGVVELSASTSAYLEAKLSLDNVCLILETASMYNQKRLSATCFQFIDTRADDILRHSSFFTLSPAALISLTSRDSFCADEIDIFKALKSWVEHNKSNTSGAPPSSNTELATSATPKTSPHSNFVVDESVISRVMGTVRLPLIGIADLTGAVRAAHLVLLDTIVDAIATANNALYEDLNLRRLLKPGVNLATSYYKAQAIRGERTGTLLNGDNVNYDYHNGYSAHALDDHGESIDIKLGYNCIINTIRILLFDKDSRSYSYFIKSSTNNLDWTTLVDHSRYLCRSWQNLRFPEQVVRYIRIVGTHTTASNRRFHIVSFECMYSNSPVTLDKGLIVPLDNVATTQMSAAVIRGASNTSNSLINGDLNSENTSHPREIGDIVVQLGQPYVIGSIRMLLGYPDTRWFSYFIEVSNDRMNWTRVVDRTWERCRGWQVVQFSRRPVTFIKIRGLWGSFNDGQFHCVHFECPAECSSLKEYNTCWGCLVRWLCILSYV